MNKLVNSRLHHYQLWSVITDDEGRYKEKDVSVIHLQLFPTRADNSLHLTKKKFALIVEWSWTLDSGQMPNPLRIFKKLIKDSFYNLVQKYDNRTAKVVLIHSQPLYFEMTEGLIEKEQGKDNILN